MLGGRKVRSNKGKKRGSYRTRKTHHAIRVKVNSKGNRAVSRRKTRSNKGKKRTPYGPRTGKTRSGRKFRGGGHVCGNKRACCRGDNAYHNYCEKFKEQQCKSDDNYCTWYVNKNY